MATLTIQEIIKILQPKEIIGNAHGIKTQGACIDSRKVTEDCIFFALQGENHDGYNFIAQSIKKGAKCCITDCIPEDIRNNSHELQSGCIVVVKDVIKAMQDLAKYLRLKLKAKVICVTGSLGKTTTKEMIGYVLSRFYQTSISEGSKNNHIGLPLSILNAKTDDDLLVLEVGMNHSGEILELSSIAKPDIAIITTIAPTHIGNFETMEDIADAKSEIFQNMNGENPIVILNQDNEYFPRLVSNARQSGIKTILGLGHPEKSPIYIDNWKIAFNSCTFDVVFRLPSGTKCEKCSMMTIAHSAAYNTIFLFVLAKLLKIDIEKVIDALKSFKGVEGRGNMLSIMSGKKRINIINDSYNASPESMKSAIKTLLSLGKEETQSRLVCVLGDMLELGKFSQQYHESIAEFINNSSISLVFTIGQEMKYLYDKIHTLDKQHFENAESAKRKIRDSLQDKDIVLVKGSKKINLPIIIDQLYQA